MSKETKAELKIMNIYYYISIALLAINKTLELILLPCSFEIFPNFFIFVLHPRKLILWW